MLEVDPSRPPRWSARLAAHIGRTVSRIRRSQGDDGRRLTAQALADRCEALGHPLDRSVIAKLEKGFRENVSVADLIALAKALGVPPVLLVFPVGHEERVELLPGVEVDTWQAVRWFTGQGPIRDADPDAYDEWEKGSEPLRLFRWHFERMTAWRQLNSAADLAARQLANAGDDEAARTRIQARLSATEGEIRQAESALRQIRDDMRAAELAPPALAPGMEHIDVDPLTAAVAAHYRDQERKGDNE